MDEKAILGQSRWFWPVVLFPYAKGNAHTRTWTGRTTLKDVKGGLSRCTARLTAEAITIRGLLLRAEHLRIPLAAVTDVLPSADKIGIVKVRFAEAHWGLVARMATSGNPPGARDRIFLNVDDPETWLIAIREAIIAVGDEP